MIFVCGSGSGRYPSASTRPARGAARPSASPAPSSTPGARSTPRCSGTCPSADGASTIAYFMILIISGRRGTGPGQLALDHGQVEPAGPAALLDFPRRHVHAEGLVHGLDGSFLEFAERPAPGGEFRAVGACGLRGPVRARDGQLVRPRVQVREAEVDHAGQATA